MRSWSRKAACGWNTDSLTPNRFTARLRRAAFYFRVIARAFAVSPTPFPPSSRRCLRCRCGIGLPATHDKDGAANSRTGSTRSTARQRGDVIARIHTGVARQSSRNPVLAVRRRALRLNWAGRAWVIRRCADGRGKLSASRSVQG